MEMRCPICQGEAWPLDVVDFHKNCLESRGVFFQLSGVPIYYYRCRQCGFAWAPFFQNWTPEDFKKGIYNHDYVRVDPEYLEVRPRNNVNLLSQWFGTLPPELQHLDYGGGNGLLSEQLRAKGWTSQCWDPFDEKSAGLPPPKPAAADLITAFEVFEHVVDPVALIKRLEELLRSNGVIVFTTMLSDGHLEFHRRIDWWYASPRNGHISLYSRASLEKLCAKENLRVAHLSETVHVAFREIPGWAADFFTRFVPGNAAADHSS